CCLWVVGRGGASHHGDDFDHVAVGQRAACVAVALEDLAVDFDRNRARVDTQLAEVVEQTGWSWELDWLAVHPELDHRSRKYPIAAKPDAPASRHAAALAASTPPTARTGLATHRNTSRKASSPTGRRPGWEALAKTGPKMT